MFRTLTAKIWSGISALVSNSLTLRFLEILRRFQKHLPGIYANEDHNHKALQGILPLMHSAGGYMELQSHCKGLKFGRFSMTYNGCEVIALYNALHCLFDYTPSEFPTIISDLEKNGILLSGLMGTSPIELISYLRKKGLSVRHTAKVSEMSDIADTSSVCILSFYNDAKDIRKQLHTVCIHKEPDGFYCHNAQKRNKPMGPFLNLTSLISSLRSGNIKPVLLIGINN